MNGARSGSANAVHPGAGLPPHPQNSERSGMMKNQHNMAEQHEKPPPSKRKSANSNRSKSAQRKASGQHIKQEVLPSETGGLGM